MHVAANSQMPSRPISLRGFKSVVAYAGLAVAGSTIIGIISALITVCLNNFQLAALECCLLAGSMGVAIAILQSARSTHEALRDHVINLNSQDESSLNSDRTQVELVLLTTVENKTGIV